MYGFVICRKAWISILVGLTFILMHAFTKSAAAQWETRTQLYLVSIGSGDPDNMTLRAVNTIKDSDIIFCPIDCLVPCQLN